MDIFATITCSTVFLGVLILLWVTIRSILGDRQDKKAAALWHERRVAWKVSERARGKRSWDFGK